jgi:hypothetical protein
LKSAECVSPLPIGRHISRILTELFRKTASSPLVAIHESCV